MALAQDRWETQTRNARSYMVWSGVQTITTILSTANQRMYFSNPTGSNTNIFIVYLATDSLVNNMTIANVYLNPTTFAGGSNLAITNMQVGTSGSSSVAVCKADVSTTATSGGSQIAGLGVPPSTKTLHPECRFMLPPGNAIGVNLSFTGLALNTQLGQVLAFWYEEGTLAN